MRSQDLILGETYVLADPSVRVTVLPTPDELRAKARVMVRFQNGVIASRETDIPTRRIAGPADRALAPKRPAASPVRAFRLAPERAARIGDLITMIETGELQWVVDEVDDKLSTATVSTTIFERPCFRTVALDQLQLCAVPIHRRVSDDRTRAATAPATVDHAAELAEQLRPIAPRRQLDELMDDVLFTERCLVEYKRRLGRGQRGDAIEQLREEVRRSGYLLNDGLAPAGEYARIKVNGRFEIVLERKPTPDAPLTVDRLRYVGRRRSSAGKGQRRAA